MSKTKKDLENENKVLKAEIRDLRKSLSEQLEDLKTAKEIQNDTENNLTYTGYGVILDEERYRVVNIKFDKETGNARVTSSEDVPGVRKDMSRLVYKCKQKMAEICKEAF